MGIGWGLGKGRGYWWDGFVECLDLIIDLLAGVVVADKSELRE